MEAIASTHFSERQEKYSQDLLEAVRKELDTIEIPKPLLSPQEVKDRDNFLLIHKYARNAFRLSFSIRVPEIGVEDPN
ncbi:hypothetical protein AUJ42_01715 [Candidatus Collierbacteria bacterium CG1_02_44_10]|nr:MAG: hypothetical protein AUJ42_01715 [Candidatus Collierbacteria bacterium CG1_02_44_10]PIP85748.1 MAG: hypothetical protein COW83_02595 [Candidatus Collierbacteria bacterium CG22_combo_CG10-13_8_21_14_all_43_12]PIR99436.1 MAG: hypothetical protein COT86_04040 [Candidatus Collierbacteria bacterium CG10_big_fil_rev_8_21_14_0_10_43_36]